MQTNSKELFEYSKMKVPGGVHSPVRSFKNLHTTPRFMVKGEGAYIHDVEGKDYIDFCMSFGPLILGHQDPIVKADLQKALDNGWSYGACEPYSVELVRFLTEKLDFIDQLRFVNSGTEAVMTALRLARGATGKSKIIKFNGCYHGHVDSMLIKAGSGLAGEPEASSKGIPEGVSHDTIVLELNDREQVEQAFEKYKDDIACIIIEPLPANNGLLIQDQEYLQFLRKITEDNKSLLIFDEVISGFRVCFGGMAKLTGITPDIVTYGKIIGGGLPVGAIAGKESIMQHLAPVGGVYQAGTLSANPLAMVGGLSTLKQLTCENYIHLSNYTTKICKVFNEFFSGKSEFNNLNAYSFGSLFWIKPEQERIKTIQQIPADISETFEKLFEYLLDRGVYLAPNAYEVGFVSLAHNDKVIEELKNRICN